MEKTGRKLSNWCQVVVVLRFVLTPKSSFWRAGACRRTNGTRRVLEVLTFRISMNRSRIIQNLLVRFLWGGRICLTFWCECKGFIDVESSIRVAEATWTSGRDWLTGREQLKVRLSGSGRILSRTLGMRRKVVLWRMRLKKRWRCEKSWFYFSINPFNFIAFILAAKDTLDYFRKPNLVLNS